MDSDFERVLQLPSGFLNCERLNELSESWPWTSVMKLMGVGSVALTALGVGVAFGGRI